MTNKKLIILAIFLLFFSGCTQPRTENETPAPSRTQYTEGDLFENVAPDESAEPEKTDIISGENLLGAQDMPENPGYLEVQENIVYVKYDAANRYRDSILEWDKNSLFCVDQATGVAYFVNQNQDWYIYRLYDGKTELAVELPARDLHILDGTLYFILEDYDTYLFDGITEGDIYAYAPTDGSISKVFSAEALVAPIEAMIPYEDGIAFYCFMFSKLTEDGTEIVVEDKREATRAQFHWYFYSYVNEKLEEDPYKRSHLGWGDYYLMPVKTDEGSKVFLWSRENGKQDALDLNAKGAAGFIIENTLYSFNAYEICITDIYTGEQERIDTNEIFRRLSPVYVSYWIEEAPSKLFQFGSFTVTKDSLWVVISGQFLLRIAKESKEATCYMFTDSASKINNSYMGGMIEALYTDGVKVYALYREEKSEGDQTYSMVRICPDEVIGWHEGYGHEVLRLEHLIEE